MFVRRVLPIKALGVQTAGSEIQPYRERWRVECGGFEDPAHSGKALVKGLAFWRRRSNVAAA